MYKKIIWANDGSPTMERVYPVVRELANDSGASLTVAHVHETMRLGHHPLFADSHQALDALLQQTVDQLSAAVGPPRRSRTWPPRPTPTSSWRAPMARGRSLGSSSAASPLRCCRLRPALYWWCPGTPTTVTAWCWQRRARPQRTPDDDR